MSSLPDGTDGRLAPEAAFSLLGHELRLEILWAIWTAPDGTATFSEIRDRVGVEDNGRLNYHRGELTDHFIRRVGEEGYTLRQAGLHVIQAIHAGTFTDHAERERTTLDGACGDCGGTLAFRYVDDMANVFCVDCGRLWNEHAFPPAGVDGRTNEELAVAHDRWERARLRLAADGICPACGGRMTADLIPVGHYHDYPTHVRYECRHCTFHPRETLGERVLRHPATVTLFYDHGVDLAATPCWELPFCFDEDYVETETDPLCAHIRVPCEGEELVFAFDADGHPTVVE
ncbi:winged helix-turn-helix domain-containing protein [Halomarina oriensis]|uniref:ArsR family transcriptional regulator n=1 Tax=Halomarina oriensis TaxID=671145 RepID=A0A6B0GSF7_9EURY|nr:helix-turn-helix domain-containing protein [Halomarina oriensis]MWG36629.1 ArsR family transcriptional regulator [Halomarina oriensis]